jgi:galactokinase
MLGKKNNVILLDCKNITHHYFPLRMEGYKIVLLNSKVHHSLAAGEYNIRRRQCEEGLQVLKSHLAIGSFRDIASADDMRPCQSLMSEDTYRRCTYVVEEILRTQKAAILLQEDSMVEFGKLMYASHWGLSRLYDVSCKELDFLVQQAQQNPDVIGARLMGGGFGGCTINLVKESAVDDFIAQSGAAYKKEFLVSHEAYIVETADGTHKII